jgi:hypothetical protein
VFLELKEFWKYNDFNPNRAKDLINELKKHEPYHAPKWDDLGDFRRICVQYYTKEKDAFEAFQKALGGKSSKEEKKDWLDEMIDNLPNVPISEFEIEEWANDSSLVSWFSEDEQNNHITLTEEEFNSIGEQCRLEGVKFYQDNWTDDLKWIKENCKLLEILLTHCFLDFYCCYDGWFGSKTGFILFTTVSNPHLHMMVIINENRQFPDLLISPYKNLFSDDYCNELFDADDFIKIIQAYRPLSPFNCTQFQEGDRLNKRVLKIFNLIINYINNKSS